MSVPGIKEIKINDFVGIRKSHFWLYLKRKVI